ncbi:MAG: ABC transporter ATP-binding protein [Anaerolineales bacterium]|nr:ABC transporter ATP-binding protein [Anaerolineales bacterium]
MIETQDLSKQFHDFMAVDGVNLTVGAGKILALLGQNGAGKTTTVRMLTAILHPSRGSARVAGYDVAKNGHAVRAEVGALTEHHGLYMRMTALEYMDFFGRIYNLSPALRKSRIDNLLEYFGLAEAAKRRIGEYSKGMRQKLALARAMIHEPSVLLLDEPTSAMDPESARLVRDEIARLKSAQRAIMLCSHNLSEVEALADQVAIIYRGKILIQGGLDEVKTQALGSPKYIVQFASAWDAAGLELPQGMELLEKTPTSLKVKTDAPQQTNPELIRRLAALSAPTLALQEEKQTLEQAYLQTMAAARGIEYAQ